MNPTDQDAQKTLSGPLKHSTNPHTVGTEHTENTANMHWTQAASEGQSAPISKANPSTESLATLASHQATCSREACRQDHHRQCSPSCLS